MPISLSEIPCFKHLFSILPIQSEDCQVKRTAALKSPILHIINGIWIFNNLNIDDQCTIQKHQRNINLQSTIDNQIITHLGCTQSIKCSNRRPVRSKCSNQPIMIFDTATGQYKQETNFHIPLNPLKQSILAKYKKDMLHLFEQMKEFENENITTITRFHRKFFTLIIFILLLLLSTLISLCVRFIQNRIKQQLYIAERRINNLQDVFLGNDDQI